MYLTNLKNSHKNKDDNKSAQLFHYIEEGRKIKLELYEYFSYDFDLVAKDIMKDSNKCFDNKFSMWKDIYKVNSVKIKEYQKQMYERPIKT